MDGGRLRRNVAEGSSSPKVQRKEMRLLTAAQVETLAGPITPPYGVLVRFAAYTGLRPWELVALKVGRLDLLRLTMRETEAAPEAAGHLEWGGVKTHEARTVRLPRSLAEELGAYLADRRHGRDDLVFHCHAWWPAAVLEVRARPLQAGHRGREPGHRPGPPGQSTGAAA